MLVMALGRLLKMLNQRLLYFTEWDVVYCSNPTSPGGGYRSAVGRLVFKTKEMLQVIEAPDTVRNKVSFSAFGSLDGEVSLNGKSASKLANANGFIYIMILFYMLANFQSKSSP